MRTEIALWVVFTIIGVLIGMIAFILAITEEYIIQVKIFVTQHFMSMPHTPGALYTSFGFYVIYSMVVAGIAAALTVYVAPGATGSGIPELMGYLNGVKYPKILSFKVLVIKVVGVILAVSGTLCIGKEGPLAHIGAIVAVLILYLPFKFFKQFQNDVR